MRYALLIPLATAFSLAFLYTDFLYVFAGSGVFSRATPLEISILGIQVGKVAVISGIKRLRHISLLNYINIAGAELPFLLLGLLLVYLDLGNHSIANLMNQIFLAWVAGVTVAGAPYGIYRLARGMWNRERLALVLPSGILLSELIALMLVGAHSIANSGSGIVGLSRAILLYSVGLAGKGIQAFDSYTVVIFAILYVSLTLHALLPADLDSSIVTRASALALFASVITYSVAYLASEFSVPMTYIGLPSTLLVAGLIWWITRGV
ncbi:MAG TPA: hypothetical protein VEJ19_02940 [Nitrososphaerales archaeon]|nr:hypothetical protein [Nitrososphaerales archaeon]